MQRERKVFILNKKYKHIDIITKPIVAILIAALLVTNAPEYMENLRGKGSARR